MPVIHCPRCKKPVRYERVSDVPTFPFCCERCRLLDLGDWLDERYRISEPLVANNGEAFEDDPKSGQ